MSKSNSFLDGLMMGLGKQLGKRRRDVNKAIEKFHEENNKEETPQASKPGASVEAPNNKSADDTTEKSTPEDAESGKE